MTHIRNLFLAALVTLAGLTAPVAHAEAMSDYLESALLGHVFKGAAYAGPSTTYVGLSTTAAGRRKAVTFCVLPVVVADCA